MRTEPDDIHARVADSFGRMAFMATLGAELVAVEPGRVVLACDRSEAFTQQHGFVHAGVLASLLDSACGWAALTLMAPDHAVLTVEFKVNLLRPADGRRFDFVAEVVKPGRTLTVCDAVVCADGDGSRPIATMSATLMAVVDRGLSD